MNFLGQHVNSFGLIIAKNKVTAVKMINYPAILGNLKHFLGLIKYLKSSIHYPAQVAQSLQNLKIILFKHVLIAKAQQKAFASCTKVLLSTNAKLVSFSTLNERLSLSVMLVHYSMDCIFWIDLNALKEFGFSLIQFHTTKDYKPNDK